MRRRIYITLLCCCLGFSALSQDLNSYLKMAADSNALLKSKFLEYQASLERVPQMGSLPDPEVSFGYFVSPVETRIGAQEAKISGMQMFPWFGYLGAKKDMAREMALSKYALFEATKNELFYSVKDAYYNLYKVNQSIIILEEHLIILASFERIILTKVGTGNKGMTDILRISMEQAELETKIEGLKDKSYALSSRLNHLLNRKSDAAIQITDSLEVTLLAFSKTEYAQKLALENDKLESIRHMKQSGQYATIAAKRSSKPMFGIGLNYVFVSENPGSTMPNNGNDAFMPMINLKLPIYRKKYKAKVKEAQLNLDAIQYMELEHQNMLKTQFEMAMADYNDAQRRLALFGDQKVRAEKTQDLLIKSYSTDGKDFEEILRVQRMQLNFDLRLLHSLIDINLAVAKIESLI